MNIGQIEDIRREAKLRIREIRSESPPSTVSILDRQDPIPRKLILDSRISSGAVRAYAVLGTHAPTIFPGVRSLGRILGGADGAVRTTDELFLFGWLTKEIQRGRSNEVIGSIYILFPCPFDAKEMASLGVSWVDFVIRLAVSKVRRKSRLRDAAALIIAENPSVFSNFKAESTFVESAIVESANVEHKYYEVEVLPHKEIFTKKPSAEPMSKNTASGSFSENFGFAWGARQTYLAESEALRIANLHKLDGSQAYRVAGEFAAEALRGFRKPPGDAWFWLCKKQATQGLAHTQSGDQNLPSWGG